MSDDDLRLFDPPAPELDPAAPSDLEPPAEPSPAELRDPRQMAFSVVGRGAAALLRSTFDSRRLTTALAVYHALTQLASEARSHEFRAPRKRVAALAGVTDRTLDPYVREFERVGLLGVERPTGGRHHPSNLWRLLMVPGDVRGEGNRTPSDSGGEANHTPNGFRGEANRTPGLKKKDVQEEGNVLPFPRSRNRQSASRAGDRPDYNQALR